MCVYILIISWLLQNLVNALSDVNLLYTVNLLNYRLLLCPFTTRLS